MKKKKKKTISQKNSFTFKNGFLVRNKSGTSGVYPAREIDETYLSKRWHAEH